MTSSHEFFERVSIHIFINKIHRRRDKSIRIKRIFFFYLFVIFRNEPDATPGNRGLGWGTTI